MLKGTVRRVAYGTEKWLQEWGGGANMAPKFHELNLLFGRQSTVAILQGTPGEAFERNASSGLLEYSLYFASCSVLAKGDEFPDMVSMSLMPQRPW